MNLLRFYGLNEQLTDDDRETLHLLQHDKELTGAEYDQRLPAIDRALAMFKKPCTTPLYRGLPPGRGNASFDKLLKFKGYASFSESLEIAEGFADQTGVIVKLVRARDAFCYYEWLESEFRAMDRDSFEMADGDWAIQAARDEAEWIFPFASTFQVNRTTKRNGITLIEVI